MNCWQYVFEKTENIKLTEQLKNNIDTGSKDTEKTTQFCKLATTKAPKTKVVGAASAKKHWLLILCSVMLA